MLGSVKRVRGRMKGRVRMRGPSFNGEDALQGNLGKILAARENHNVEFSGP